MEQKKKIQEMVLKEVDSTVYSLRKSLKRRLDAAMESPATTQSMRDPTMATATPHGGALTLKEFDLLSKAQFTKKRSTAHSAKKARLSEDLVTLTVCQMRRTRRKGYGKAGDYVEIRVPYKSTYCQVAQAAAEAVDLEPELSSDDSDHDHEEAQKPALVLLRAQGCVLQNKPLVTEPDTNEQVEWTIGSYLSTFPSFRRSRQAIKLGVGRDLTEQMEQSHKQHHDGSGPQGTFPRTTGYKYRDSSTFPRTAGYKYRDSSNCPGRN